MPQQAEDDSSEALDTIRKAISEVIADSKEPVRASLTGGVVIVEKSQEILLRDLFRSFMTAFAVIAIVMVLMLRSVLGGLIAMAPNLFPTVALFGFMGLLAIRWISAQLCLPVSLWESWWMTRFIFSADLGPAVHVVSGRFVPPTARSLNVAGQCSRPLLFVEFR